MKTKILLARPRASSERLAKLLADQGFHSVIEPLLTITPTEEPRPSGTFQAVLITSSNAIDALKASKVGFADLVSLPCFCVGVATAETARKFGFMDVRHGSTDSLEIAQNIVGQITDKDRPVLHICGDIIENKAQEVFTRAQVPLALWTVYRATAADDFSPAVKDMFAEGSFSAIPVFSPRSARVLVSLIEKNRLVPICHKMVAVALSQAVADMLQTLPWRQLRVAANPTEESVIACIKAELLSLETSAQPTTQSIKQNVGQAASASLTRSVKKGRSMWKLATVLLILALGGLAYDYIVFPHTLPLNTRPPVDVVELAQRVHILETRLDTQDEATAPSRVQTLAANTMGDADVAAIKEQVKTLQNEILVTKNETQKEIASAFAFWDLRDAIRNGRPFAHEFETLRLMASSDSTISDPMARLEPLTTEAVPTSPELLSLLVQDEASFHPVIEGESTWWGRVKQGLQSLVSVHPVHNPEFGPLETALNTGDYDSASKAFDLLSIPAQQHLAQWHNKLHDRITVDSAVNDLRLHLVPATLPGSTP